MRLSGLRFARLLEGQRQQLDLRLADRAWAGTAANAVFIGREERQDAFGADHF